MNMLRFREKSNSSIVLLWNGCAGTSSLFQDKASNCRLFLGLGHKSNSCSAQPYMIHQWSVPLPQATKLLQTLKLPKNYQTLNYVPGLFGEFVRIVPRPRPGDSVIVVVELFTESCAICGWGLLILCVVLNLNPRPAIWTYVLLFSDFLSCCVLWFE